MFKELMAGKSIYVPKDEWLDPLKNCHIVDIVIIDNEKISILLRESIPVDSEDVWDHEIPSYIYSIYLDDNDVKTGYRRLEGFDFPKSASPGNQSNKCYYQTKTGPAKYSQEEVENPVSKK